VSDFWRGKRVLVTGAGGFIGSHLVERLVELGAEVRALVKYTASGSHGLLDQLPVLTREKIDVLAGDLLHPETADIAAADMDVVFHLAAIIAIPFSYVRPEQVFQNNTVSTLNLLQACRRAKVQRFVHTSSSEVYGTAQQIPITESHSLEAQSPYAASKIAADKLVQSFHLSYDVPAVTLRPFNTYGPRQSARAIIPTIITQAHTQKKVMLGAMHPTRDLNFVTDTVEGFVRIGETPGVEGRTYHIGSGHDISIGDLADRILKIIGGDIPVAFDPTRIRPAASEVNRLVCDASRAKAELGWTPRVSLDEGLQKTIDWIGQNLTAYRAGVYTI
jgi:NAD dependent epimerase/dehydratase